MNEIFKPHSCGAKLELLCCRQYNNTRLFTKQVIQNKAQFIHLTTSRDSAKYVSIKNKSSFTNCKKISKFRDSSSYQSVREVASNRVNSDKYGNL